MDFGDNSFNDFFDKLHNNSKKGNLKKIFEDDQKALENESNCLRYQPQKSNKNVEQMEKQTSKDISHSKTHGASSNSKSEADVWNTILAKVCHGFKADENIGRVGVALSRNGAGSIKLVVYKSRAKVLSVLLLAPWVRTEPSHMVIFRESYLQFYDDADQFWSVRFESQIDEGEFMQTMQDLKLPLQLPEQQSSTELISPQQQDSEVSQKLTVIETKPTSSQLISEPPTSQVQKQTQVLPQPYPQPRPRKHSSAMQLQTPSRFNDNAVDSSDEQDMIGRAPLEATGSTTPYNALLPLLSSMGISVSNVSCPVDRFHVKMNEQHGPGQLMEAKIASFLETMTRMACSSSMSNELNTQQQIPVPQSVVQQRDNEDEMLELEQKLLDAKKENRALIKRLKCKEEALAELRNSSCVVCEQLVAQNTVLKQQNSALLANAKSQAEGLNSPSQTAIMDQIWCAQCQQYELTIVRLENRLAVLQTTLAQMNK